MNHKDACPLLTMEARDAAERMNGFAIIIKSVGWDLESGSVCVCVGGLIIICRVLICR